MIALLATAALQGAAPDFEETVLRVPKNGAALALRDATGDGALDLLRVDEEGIALIPLLGARTYADEPASFLAWPGERVGWDLGDLDGDGADDVILLAEEGGVRVHRVSAEGAFGPGEPVLEATAHLPAGRTRVRFARDVDGDGWQDLVLPGAGAHHIHLRRGDDFAAPIEVVYELDASYDAGDPTSLSASIGQRVRVPWFRVQDVDGDGRDDLVSETSERIAFHLAAPELDSVPTWILDLEALRAELPARRDLNLDDLFSNLDQQVSWKIADLDGEAPSDLVVLLGSKFRVYLGGARGGPSGTPDQVLKSSGNVLLTYVRQVEGDPLPDLQIVRGERISVGRVLRALILPSSLDFDVFTYENSSGAFSRSPTRRNTVRFEIPRLLSLIDDEGFEIAIEQQFDVPARRLPRDPTSPAAGDDVADVADGQLVVFSGCAPAPTAFESLEGDDVEGDRFVESLFLEDLDEREDGATRTIDLGDIATYDFAPGAVLRKACAGLQPALRHPLAVEQGKVEELRVRDLDGDGRQDVIVVGELDDEWVVQLLVRR